MTEEKGFLFKSSFNYTFFYMHLFCRVALDEKITSLPTGADGKPDFRNNHGCCRDCPCLVLFLGCVIAAIVLFAYGFMYGHPSDLINPINSKFVTFIIIITQILNVLEVTSVEERTKVMIILMRSIFFLT